MSKFTPIFAGKQAVGAVCGEAFRKRICGSRHLLQRPPALAFDVASLEAAQKAGARRVEVEDAETGRVFITEIARIWRDGFTFERGFGRQIALPIGRFRVESGDARQLSFEGVGS